MALDDQEPEASEGLLGWVRLAVEAAAPLLLFAWLLPTLLVIGLAEDPQNKPPLLIALVYGAGWGAALVALVGLALLIARLWTRFAEARELAQLAASSTIAPADLALPATTWIGVRRIGAGEGAAAASPPGPARAPTGPARPRGEPLSLAGVLRGLGGVLYGLSAMLAVAIGGVSVAWEAADHLAWRAAGPVDCEAGVDKLPGWVQLDALPLREEVRFVEVEGQPNPVRVIAYLDIPFDGGPCVDVVSTDPARIALAESAYALRDEPALREALGFAPERPARVLPQWQTSRSWRALTAPRQLVLGGPPPPLPEAYVEVTFDPRPAWSRLPLIGLPLGLFALGAWAVRLLRGAGLRLW